MVHAVPECREYDGVDGEPVVFEWKIFPGHTTLQLHQAVPRMMEEQNTQSDKFKDRIIFMSMYNDIDWGQRGNKKNVRCILEILLPTP